MYIQRIWRVSWQMFISCAVVWWNFGQLGFTSPIWSARKNVNWFMVLASSCDKKIQPSIFIQFGGTGERKWGIMQ